MDHSLVAQSGDSLDEKMVVSTDYSTVYLKVVLLVLKMATSKAELLVD